MKYLKTVPTRSHEGGEPQPKDPRSAPQDTAPATGLAERGTDRGRDASAPSKIPTLGWRDILLRARNKIAEDNVSLVSAGIAFYALLSLFPALATLISLYGIVADPSDIRTYIEAFPGLPSEAKNLIAAPFEQTAASSSTALGVGFGGAFILSIWSASRGTKALLVATHIAYEERESRGFLRRNAIAMVVTAALLVATAIGLVVVAVLPAVLQLLGLPRLQQWVAQTLPWVFLLGGTVLGLSLLYRYGPHRTNPRWRWVTPGAIAATTAWLVGSLGFSYYMANFGAYGEAYGAVGAVVVLLLWFWMSAFVVISGAILDAEIEHQTREDSTVGPDEPMGERGAYVADHEGPIP